MFLFCGMKTVEHLIKEMEKLNVKVDRLTQMVQHIPVTHNTTLEDWLTEEQTKELLGKGTTSLWSLRKTGKLKFSKIGGRIYYSRESIIAHLNSNAINKR